MSNFRAQLPNYFLKPRTARHHPTFKKISSWFHLISAGAWWRRDRCGAEHLPSTSPSLPPSPVPPPSPSTFSSPVPDHTSGLHENPLPYLTLPLYLRKGEGLCPLERPCVSAVWRRRSPEVPSRQPEVWMKQKQHLPGVKIVTATIKEMCSPEWH